MREIKFRVWDKSNKRWEDEGVLLRARNGTVASNQPELYDVQQYTGLHDKKGVEVYEGDILAPMPNDYRPEYKGVWVVDFREGTFVGNSPENREITWMPYWSENQIEVIGNVWESPALLESK